MESISQKLTSAHPLSATAQLQPRGFCCLCTQRFCLHSTASVPGTALPKALWAHCIGAAVDSSLNSWSFAQENKLYSTLRRGTR